MSETISMVILFGLVVVVVAVNAFVMISFRRRMKDIEDKFMPKAVVRAPAKSASAQHSSR